MSKTHLKLATIAYLSVMKAENEKLSWTDVSKAMTFFESGKHRDSFAELIRYLCTEDSKFEEAEANVRATISAEKLTKFTQLFKGRVRNLAQPNGQIAITEESVKSISFTNADKNNGGHAYLVARINPAVALLSSTWSDFQKKIKEEFTEKGGTLCPDLLMGVVWDSSTETLRLVNNEALESWCIQLAKLPKRKGSLTLDILKSNLQKIIKDLFNKLDVTGIKADEQTENTVDKLPSTKFTGNEIPTFKILHGPPGTGKTTLAKKFCEERGWTPYIVQIHPSYTYEEFIEGLKPVTFANGELKYDIVQGPVMVLANKISGSPINVLCSLSIEDDRVIFRLPLGLAERHGLSKVCLFLNGSKSESYYQISADSFMIKKSDLPPEAQAIREIVSKLESEKEYHNDAFQKIAMVDHDSTPRKYCLILDEINRGNVSQLLGELLFSISETESENPKPVKLQYSQTSFVWPEGLSIIGTMNTTDVSTERMDQAIKRRFAFEYIEPNPGLYNLREESFDFLKVFNEKATQRDGSFKKLQNLNEVASVLGKTKKNYSQLLVELNDKLFASAKSYGLINIKDKLIGHSFFIKMSRRVCFNFEGPVAWELAFYGEFKEMLLGEFVPALQSIFNHDDESLNKFMSDWLGKSIKGVPGTEKWADDVMTDLLWDDPTKLQTISLDMYRQRQWKKSA